jgi:hypothetical protein
MMDNLQKFSTLLSIENNIIPGRSCRPSYDETPILILALSIFSNLLNQLRNILLILVGGGMLYVKVG